MKKLRNFFKAHKGKEMVEIIVLTPITIWLIIFTTVRLLSYVISTEVQKDSSSYIRCFITEKSFYEGITALAKQVDTNPYDTVILSISLTDYETGEVRTLSFSNDETETTYFKNMYYSNGSGRYFFNYDVSSSFESNYRAVADFFKRGNYVEIVTQREINSFISTISNVTFYNPTTKENVTLSYLTPGLITANTKNIIIS